MARGGNVPAYLPTEFSSYIAGPPAATESDAAERARALEKGRFHRILWPVLAIVLFALLGIWIARTRGAMFDAARELQLATQRATSALAALTPGFTAFDLVDALNLDVINFAPGSADIPTDNYDFLNKAATAIMAAPPGTVIGITGNTDNTGDPDSNMQLSQERALAVRDYLVARGVDGAALTVAGTGDRNPVAGNDTEEGRFRNRRIQFSVAN